MNVYVSVTNLRETQEKIRSITSKNITRKIRPIKSVKDSKENKPKEIKQKTLNKTIGMSQTFPSPLHPTPTPKMEHVQLPES